MSTTSTLLAAALAALLAWVGMSGFQSAPEMTPDTTSEPRPAETMETPTLVADGRHDFDFLHGTYRVRNRRLKERLAGCTEWVEFDAVNTAKPILDGLGNQDEFRTEHWPGFVGMSFRFFDPQTGQWSIYWADNRRGSLEPPVRGAFIDDIGLFEGDDQLNGNPIRVRFVWTRGRDAARWEQAFSADGGKTWETNWIMEFSR